MRYTDPSPCSLIHQKYVNIIKQGKERAWLAIPRQDRTCTHLQPAKQTQKKGVQIPIQMSAFLTTTCQPINSTTFSLTIYHLSTSSLPSLHSLGFTCPSLWWPLYKHLVCPSPSARCSTGRSSLKPITHLLWACTQEAEHHWRKKSHNHANWSHFKFVTR